MNAQVQSRTLLAGAALAITLGGAAPLGAQMPQGAGNAVAGEAAYKRYCIGCHGPQGDGRGENAQWIEPKPRDFTEAMFKCRSTPTGTLPTDEDLFHSVSRGFVTTNMPPWAPLPAQARADVVAYIKAFSPRWQSEQPG